MRVALIALFACSFPPPPIGLNDPRKATAFYCSVSPDRQHDICMITESECTGVVQAAARQALFMSPCTGGNTAWCAVSQLPSGWDLYSCAPDRDGCGYRRDEDVRVNRSRNVGECGQRTAGK